MYRGSSRADSVYMSLLHQCSDHRDGSFDSPLCGVCEHDYAPADVGSPSTGCVACDSVSWLKVCLLLGVSWVFVVVYYIAANGRLGMIGILLYYFQTIAIMVSSHSSLTAWFWTFFAPIPIMSFECLAPMSAEMQYALPLFITPLQLIQLLLITIIHALMKRRFNDNDNDNDNGNISTAAATAAAASAQQYKLDPLTMTYVMTSPQHLLYSRQIRFPYSYQWWIILIQYRLWPELTVSTVCRAVFLIASASFTSVLLTCISWFQCTEDITIGLSAAGVSGSVVFAFPAISCRSSAYYAWSFVMAGFIVIWLLIIAALFLWLLLYRGQLAMIQRRSTSSSSSSSSTAAAATTTTTTTTTTMTTTQTRTDIYNLHSLVPMALIPHISDKHKLSLFVPFMNVTRFNWYWPVPATHEQADEQAYNNDDNDNNEVQDEPVCDTFIDGNSNTTVMETRREYAFRSMFGAVFDSFTPDAVGWTIVLLVRRLVLIILSVTLTVLPSMKNMSFVFLHMIIGIIHAYYHPYSSAILNQAETMAILVHIVVAVLLLTTAATPNDPTTASAILTIAIIPLVTYPLFHFARSWIGSGAAYEWTVRKSTSTSLNNSTNDNNLKSRLLMSKDIELNHIELDYKNDM